MLTVMGGPMSANDEARLAWSRDRVDLRGHSRGQDRAGNLPRRPDHRQSLGRAGLSRERQRNRLVPCPANGLTSYLRRHTRKLYAISLAWRDIRFALRGNAARQERNYPDSGVCRRSASSWTAVSPGGDRG